MAERELEFDPGKSDPYEWAQDVLAAIDLASDQGQMTWLTANGKRVAAIVPYAVAEVFEEARTGLVPDEQKIVQQYAHSLPDRKWVRAEFYGMLPAGMTVTNVKPDEVARNLCEVFGFEYADGITVVMAEDRHPR